MALIQAPFGTNDFLGSVGSTTFQRGPNGLIARTRSIPVNPNTPFQSAVRANMALLSSAWLTVLTPALRQGWENYAADTPLPNKFGIPRNIGGRAMFIRTNSARLQIGETIDQTAPSLPGVATLPNFDLTAGIAAGLVIDNVNPVIAAGDFLTVRLSSAQNLTKNYFSSPFRFAAVFDSTTVFPVVIIPGASLTANTRLFSRWRYITASGKVSFDSQRSSDVGP